MEKRKIWALIPARGGSKRVPGKNFRELGGRTLLSRAIFSALGAGIFKKVIVSSDAKQAYESIHPYRARRELDVEYLHRPQEISGDKSGDIDWISHVFDTYGWSECDYYAILRPTNPFRSSLTIKRAFDQLFSSDIINYRHGLRSVEPIRQRPEKAWRIFNGNMYSYHGMENDTGRSFEKQSSNFEELYMQNGCIDICRPENIKLLGGYLGLNIMPFYTHFPEGVNIDTQEDWDYAEYLVEKGW